MQKLIILLSSLGIVACASTSEKPDNINSTLSTNFNKVKSQYIYCLGESCVQPTVLEPYTIEDFKPIEPEPIPMINVLHEAAKVQVKPHKKHRGKHYKHKPKKPKSSLITKCFVVNRNESGNVVISGNKLIPVTTSPDKQVMDALESAVSKKSSTK